jgi:hypothetical protein
MILLSLAGACRAIPEETRTGGHLEAQWTGSTQGSISAPATAEWCATRRLLEIRAVQGDTGIALALYPRETLAVGVYRVMDPAKADSVPPGAGVALRWLSPTLVQGFRGESGTIELARSTSGRLSGTLTARARSIVDAQRVGIQGKFRDLAIRPESRGCTADAEPRDTGVH